MSKHNYTQYSNNKKNYTPAEAEKVEAATPVDEVVTPDEVKMESAVKVEQTEPIAEPAPTPEVKLVKETVETKPLPKTVTGTVANCVKLNVRSAPISSADIVTVIPVDTEVEINIKRSTSSWLKVTTASGIEGYCMRQFVNATL